MSQYTTVQGDTWDLIAVKVYGTGCEKYAGYLMAQNKLLLDYLVFPRGIVLDTPDVTSEYLESEELPIWRS